MADETTRNADEHLLADRTVPVTAPADAEAETKARRNAYLPVPPDGWMYGVTIACVGRGYVDVLPVEGDTYDVHVHPKGGDKSTVRVEGGLAEAVKRGVDAAKALDRLARIEADYAEARKAALAAFGGSESTGTNKIAAEDAETGAAR